MAEENDLERTEPASPRRLEQAREEGQIARSQELGAFAVMGTAGLAVWLLGAQLLTGFVGLMKNGLTLPAGSAFETDGMLARLGEQGGAGFFTIAPVLLAAFIAAIA
ncbi:MAG: EscU/YscU/HrcU family type III secretion system export apparatus switch protein, partial [Acidobacteriota bacterium]